MFRWTLACLALLGAGAAGDDPILVPGQRLEKVERVTLEIATEGPVTLITSQGAIVMGDKRADRGWVIHAFKPGHFTIELPDGPGDITALAGEVRDVSAGDFLNQAIAAINGGDDSAARTALLACRARPEKDVYDALARMFLGDIARREGRLDEALELLTGSQAAVEEGDPRFTFFCADSLGQVALARKDVALAQTCFEKALASAADPGSRALAKCRLASVASERRDFDGASALHDEALAALSAGADATYVSAVSFEAGKFFQHRGDLKRAVELLERGADSAPVWTQQVDAIGQLALLEMSRGRYGDALKRLEEVEALAMAHAPSPFDRQVRHARAAIAFSLGEFGLAQQQLEALLDGSDAREKARIHADLALLRFMQGDGKGADELFDDVLSSAEETSTARWMALNGKAAIRLDDLRAKEAAPFAQQALALATQLDDESLRTASLITVSGVSSQLGPGTKARAEAEAALAAVESQGSRDLLLSAWHNVARAALLQGDEKTVEKLLDQAWDEAMRGETAELPSLQAAQVRSRVSELAEWSEVAADLTAKQAKSGKPDLLAGFRRAEHWKARTLLAEVQGHPELPPDLVKALASALDGRTLVEYAAGRERLYAFVVQDTGVQFIDLGARRPIEELAQRFVAGLRDERELAAPGAVARDGAQLYDALLEPLPLESDRLVVVPCGELSRLPFEALVVSAPPDVTGFEKVVFVIDRLNVAYAPSAAALVALSQRTRPTAGRDVALLIGDPTYASERAEAAGGEKPAEPPLIAARSGVARWERLPHSRDELTRVARLLLTRRGDDQAKEDLFRLSSLEGERDLRLSVSGLELRLGGEASAAALAELAPRARWVHIAAHAQVDPWDTRRTGLVLAWDEASQGVFSLRDIAALQLSAELVVLSACETAEGRLLNDEGVQSIADAFLAAGARGVVATLWPVTDPQSQALMERFASVYLADGAEPDEALRSAMRELRGTAAARGAPLSAVPDPRRGHPHSWAPFLFTGAAQARSSEVSRDR